MTGDIDLGGIGTRLLGKAETVPGVSEAEAYVSSNVFTMARVETLAVPGVRGRPSIQQLKRIEDVGASVKVVVNGAVGQASTRDLSPGSLGRLVDMAVGSQTDGSRPQLRVVGQPRREDGAEPAH